MKKLREPQTAALADKRDAVAGALENDPADPRSWEWRTSRREFLTYTAIGTAALAGTLGPAQAAPHQPQAAPVLGPGLVPVTLWVNGARHRLQVEPRATLAQVLRTQLGLTGTKLGCDRGACSACTVLLDGTPLNSCMLLVLDVGARKVTTIEGLAHGEALHPVQEAFVAHDAMQCGFCTPGMVMSCAALLVRNPSPTIEEIKDATAGNLCRCGTYPKVFAATLAAAQRRRSKQ
jgi:xanthine dehydrogenase YagT iron-sulfur-binding subunit